MTSLVAKLLGPLEKVELFPSLPTHLLRWMISVHNIWKAINNDAKRTLYFKTRFSAYWYCRVYEAGLEQRLTCWPAKNPAICENGRELAVDDETRPTLVVLMSLDW